MGVFYKDELVDQAVVVELRAVSKSDRTNGCGDEMRGTLWT